MLRELNEAAIELRALGERLGKMVQSANCNKDDLKEAVKEARDQGWVETDNDVIAFNGIFLTPLRGCQRGSLVALDPGTMELYVVRWS